MTEVTDLRWGTAVMNLRGPAMCTACRSSVVEALVEHGASVSDLRGGKCLCKLAPEMCRAVPVHIMSSRAAFLC